MALKVLKKCMCLSIFDVIARRYAANGVCVHVLVGKVPLCIQYYHFLCPLDEVCMVGEHDVLEVTNGLGSIALHDHDPSPVD